jgi:hypothetical protein
MTTVMVQATKLSDATTLAGQGVWTQTPIDDSQCGPCNQSGGIRPTAALSSAAKVAPSSALSIFANACVAA